MKLTSDQLGLPEDPYSRRWILWFGKPGQSMSLRLHHWLGNDDPDAFHDHPTWFATLVLWGGYEDWTARPPELPSPLGPPVRVDKLRIGSFRFRPADHQHTVQNVKPNTWTLLLFGKPGRRWSFFPFRGKAVKRDKYFAEVGHHTKDGGRVRLRPDGSRI